MLVAQIAFFIVGKVSPTTVTPTTNIVGTFNDLGMLLGLGVVLTLLSLRFLAIEGRARTGLLVGGAAGLFVLAVVNSQLIWALIALVSLGLFIESIMKKRPMGDDGEFDGVSVVSGEREMTTESEADSSGLAAPLAALLVSIFFLIGGSTSMRSSTPAHAGPAAGAWAHAKCR